MPWDVGLRDLVARPVARSRVQRLSRLTAPVRSGPDILSFVTGGRLVSTVDHVLVGTFLIGLFVLEFAVLLFFEHPDNVLLVLPDAGIASALDKFQMGVLAAASLAVLFVGAQATKATVRISRGDGLAVIEIADDGVGGADETAGTGLQGLADRLSALDGTLRILSPPGAGTVVTAKLPCAS